MNAKLSKYTRLLIALAGLGLVSITQAQIGEVVVPDENRSCDKLVEEMAAALRSRPESLLSEVTNRVGAAPWCACELTKTAIQTVEASRDKVGEIVYTATLAAPEQYKAIATCALEVAPDAAEEIRQALLKAFGETSDEQVGFGKGKSVAVKGIRVEEPATTLSMPARSTSGFIDNIFIIPPAGFSSTPIPDDNDAPNDPPPSDDPPRNRPPNVNPPQGTDSNPSSRNFNIR